MLNNECMSILQWHPEIILTSIYPAIWEGFLTIPYESSMVAKKRIRLKLTVPDYPLLQNAKLYFGKSFVFLKNKKFTKSIKDLIRKASSVSTFFRLLQLHISELITKLDEEYNIPIDVSPKTMLQDLRNILESHSDIQLSSNSSLNMIQLSLRNIKIVLQRTNNNTIPWNVISSDLPEIPVLGSFSHNISSLSTIMDKFKQQVEIFDMSWKILSELDGNSWVIDPVPAKPYHLYRRVYLTQSLSMLITIDPLNPTSLPDLKFLGSNIDIEKQKDIVSENIQTWNPENGIIDNLLTLLNISEFPQKQEQHNITNDKNCIVMDEECCICFSLESDKELLPNKICDNVKCRRHFHTQCLLEWLQAVAGNQVIFGQIHGTCPHCEENISCTID